MVNLVRLGNNGPMVSKIGLGCMSMSAHYETDRKDEKSIETIQTAYQTGINFFDTADMYGKGENELLLNRALKEAIQRNRESLVLATKCGFVFDSQSAFGVMIDLSPEHIISACENSLKRLGTDYIDLFYLHRLPKGGIDTLKNSLDALILLLKKNKIKHIGLSEADAESIKFAYEYFHEKGFLNAFVAVQSEFSIFVQSPLKNGVLNICKDLNLSFIPYSPLCRGLLTQKMSLDYKFDKEDVRQFLPFFQEENFIYNLKLRDELSQLAESKGCTLTQLSLAWLISQGNNVIPIPGTRYAENLIENLGALDTKLTATDLRAINDIAIKIKGTRYPKELYEFENIVQEEF